MQNRRFMQNVLHLHFFSKTVGVATEKLTLLYSRNVPRSGVEHQGPLSPLTSVPPNFQLTCLTEFV